MRDHLVAGMGSDREIMNIMKLFYSICHTCFVLYLVNVFLWVLLHYCIVYKLVFEQVKGDLICYHCAYLSFFPPTRTSGRRSTGFV